MNATPVKRKLAAILATDAVGYSRMMAADEEGTMKVLSAHRSVIDGIIEFHEGRIINTAGDSVLAEFVSPTQAVRCAVEIQDALKTRNDSLPEAKRMLFRIGVNLGDVMVKGDDLLGDGVNVAARLEGIADPGMPREIVRKRSSSVGTRSHVDTRAYFAAMKSLGLGYKR